MRKIVLLLLFISILSSCGTKDAEKDNKVDSLDVCFNDYNKAWHYFREASNAKDTVSLNYIISDSNNLRNLTFLDYKKPILEAIFKDDLGKYFINFGYETGVYKLFVLVKDGDIRKDVRILELRDIDGCYKVYNFTELDNTKEILRYITKVQTTPKKKEYARITTIVDGYDVRKVNLWDSPSEKNKVIATCVNNEQVEITYRMITGEVKVKKKNGAEGWCLDGYINKKNKN